MAMTPQSWSITGGAVELGVDRRVLAKRVAVLVPAREEGNTKYYWMKDLAKVLHGIDTKALTLDAEKTRLTKEQADKTAMENEVQRGNLVDVSLIAKAWDIVGANIKTRMLAIPTKAAPLVIGSKSLPKVQAALEGVIHDALDELSRTAPGTTAKPGATGRVKAAAKVKSKPVGRRTPKAKSRVKRRAR